jgi:MFS family permease
VNPPTTRRPLVGLLLSTTLSGVGNAVVAVAVPWLVLERTGSAAAAGLVGAAAIVPVVISAVFGGALIDRFGRRVCAVAADVLSAVAVAALPIFDQLVGLGPVLIVGLVALGAVFDGPGAAAREALRPDVGRATGIPLTKINAWGEAADSVGNMVGPGLGGLMLVWVGGFGALWATVGMFVVSAIVTAWAVPALLSPPPAAREPYLRSVLEGLRFVVHDRGLRTVTLTATIIVAFAAPFQTVVLNAHLQQTGEPAQYGLVLAAFAVGGLLGALGYGMIAARLSEFAALVGAVALMGVGLAAFAFLPSVVVLTILAFAVGVVSGPINPVAALVIQHRTPDRLRGRVIGSYTSLAVAAGPVGLLVMGPVVDGAGVRVGYLVIGIGCLLAAVYATTGRKALARTDPAQAHPRA